MDELTVCSDHDKKWSLLREPPGFRGAENLTAAEEKGEFGR